jgi:hypothetical protein
MQTDNEGPKTSGENEEIEAPKRAMPEWLTKLVAASAAGDENAHRLVGVLALNLQNVDPKAVEMLAAAPTIDDAKVVLERRIAGQRLALTVLVEAARRLGAFQAKLAAVEQS